MPGARVARRRAGRAAAWLAGCLLIVLGWLSTSVALAASAAGGETAPDLSFKHALFAPAAGAMPPREGWTAVRLPDNWRRSHPRLAGFAWYRIPFDLHAPPEQPMVLFVPHVALAAEFWLNGSLLNPGVRFDGPDGSLGARMADEPVHLILPTGLFRSGRNVLEIRLQGSEKVRSGLSAIRLAPEHAVRSSWRWRYAMQVVIPYAMLVVLGAALCFLAAHIWLQRRLTVVHLLLMVAVISTTSYTFLELPIMRGEEQTVRVGITTSMYWMLCVFGYRMSGVRIRGLLWVIHISSALTLLAALALTIAGEASDRLWLITWLHVAVRAVVVALLLRHAWQRRSTKLALLGLTAALWLVTIAQSNLILMELLPWDAFRWSIVGAAPFCVVLLFFFAERFILDRDKAASEQRAAIQAERNRILQDMHDGMGSHLITALHLARREDVNRAELARTIEESLQDLRLIIDSLDLTEQDLLPLLGNLRFRLAPRLRALGITLEWDVRPPLPELDYLTPDSALAVLRIVQEAINNALQHAAPTHIRLSARADGDAVYVQVVDDGRGFDGAPRSTGSRGLSGMRLRAARLQAALSIDSSSAGTEVTLRLPVSLHAVGGEMARGFAWRRTGAA
ncbi:sensor histidine kinase [Chitinasiproducens palmae]|uniref:sensor histidine kinase n=1 Tax=Chitinasiproducens palmae TaxID=1770053 RepID=UPI002E26B194